MARSGTNTTLYSPASVTTGTATALRSAWAAGGAALGNWTVGAMQTFGAGSSERNYWVMSAGSVEILFQMNNGTLDHHSSVSSLYRSGSNFQRMLYSTFAREGGFNAAFTAGEDPLNDSFWEHITDTQGLAAPQQMVPYLTVSSGHTNPKYYLICDDTTNMCAVMVGDRDGYDHYDTAIFADDLYNNGGIHNTDQVHPEGYLHVIIQSAVTPALPYLVMFGWDFGDNSTLGVDGPFNPEIQSPWNGIAGAAMTAIGEAPTTNLLFMGHNKIYSKINSNYVRTDPFNNPVAYKGAVGSDVNYNWVRLYRYLLMPWEVGFADPT